MMTANFDDDKMQWSITGDTSQNCYFPFPNTYTPIILQYWVTMPFVPYEGTVTPNTTIPSTTTIPIPVTPKVRAVEYYENGGVKRIEYFE